MNCFGCHDDDSREKTNLNAEVLILPYSTSCTVYLLRISMRNIGAVMFATREWPLKLEVQGSSLDGSTPLSH